MVKLELTTVIAAPAEGGGWGATIVTLR